MTRTATRTLTTADLDAFAERDEWEGFGYIGSRRNAAEAIAEGEWDAPAEIVAIADGLVLANANRLGWSVERFFEWANSKPGRWAGDVLFGNDLDATTDGQLRRLMADR